MFVTCIDRRYKCVPDPKNIRDFIFVAPTRKIIFPRFEDSFLFQGNQKNSTMETNVQQEIYIPHLRTIIQTGDFML